MRINRFDTIAAELERLAAEIAAINQQPFDPRIDLQNALKDDEEDAIPPPPALRDWRLSR